MKGLHVAALACALALVPLTAWAGESRTYWDHGYSPDCEKERGPMMSRAKDYALSWCRSRGGLDKKKTTLIFVVDKGQKLGAGFKQHFCEVKGEIHCN
jgi:hypothetical protein